MNRSSAPTPAELLMKRETRLTYGEVPHELSAGPLAEMSWQIDGDRFLLRAQGDHFFFYQRGCGITVERGAGADFTEEPLWLNGSVYAAVASINGLLPVHASAVAYAGRVFAFAGDTGAGKSTLVAALGDHGVPMFCDDTMVLDLSDLARIICLPGHKRLKLTDEALELTGAGREERVAATIEKYFARSAAGEVNRAVPLGEILFLQEGEHPHIRRLN